MKIIIKDKARFAILLVLLTEIALFIAGLLIGWIEPNPQRFALISLVTVVSVVTALSAIEIKHKAPEEPQSLDVLTIELKQCREHRKKISLYLTKNREDSNNENDT